MKVSQTIIYAVQAVIALGEIDRDAPVSSRQLAEYGKMPERFLLQILRSLVAKGVLRSSIGVSGGYSLARPPREITILQIMDAFENPLSGNSVPDLSGLANIPRKQLMACLAEAVDAARNSLSSLTLADFISQRADSKDKLLPAAI